MFNVAALGPVKLTYKIDHHTNSIILRMLYMNLIISYILLRLVIFTLYTLEIHSPKLLFVPIVYPF